MARRGGSMDHRNLFAASFLEALLDEPLSFRFHLAELSNKLSRVTGISLSATTRSS